MNINTDIKVQDIVTAQISPSEKCLLLNVLKEEIDARCKLLEEALGNMTTQELMNLHNDQKLLDRLVTEYNEDINGEMLDEKNESFKPFGGDDVLDFVRRRVRELTKEELKYREEQHESIVLRHKDVYADYIADGLSHGYVYIPCNDYFRHAMAYAMAKVYGVAEERDVMCDLFMNGYKGFTLCDDLNS